MDAYKGSPDYVRAGFLADLLGPWCNVEGSELGTHLTALHHAAETSLSIEEHKRAAILLGWIMDDLNNAFQEDWWDQSEDYAEEIKNCQSYYTDTVANWTERAKSFLGEGALVGGATGAGNWVSAAALSSPVLILSAGTAATRTTTPPR